MKTNIVYIQRRLPCAWALIGFAFLASLSVSGCGKSKNDADTEADRPVLVEPANLAAQGQLRDFVATVRPRVESDLGFRVTGKVVKRYVQAGQRVKLGDALALLDEKDLRLQKEQAEAEHAAAKMALAQAAGDALLRPQTFRAAAEYYGYTPGQPLPGQLAIAGSLKAVGDGRVCATRKKNGPCLLTFAREDGTWKLVHFDGDPSELKLR